MNLIKIACLVVASLVGFSYISLHLHQELILILVHNSALFLVSYSTSLTSLYFKKVLIMCLIFFCNFLANNSLTIHLNFFLKIYLHFLSSTSFYIISISTSNCNLISIISFTNSSSFIFLKPIALAFSFF